MHLKVKKIYIIICNIFDKDVFPTMTLLLAFKKDIFKTCYPIYIPNILTLDKNVYGKTIIEQSDKNI